MQIDIFAFSPSPRAFKVMAAANHLGLDWKLHYLDFSKGAQRSPDYAALNPNQRMPTMKHGDYVLWESNAILQYLAQQKPDAGLLPMDEPGRLDVTRWQFWELAHWDSALAILVFERVVKPQLLGITEIDASNIARGTELFQRAARVLNAHLGGRQYVCCDRLTVADFSIGAAMNLAGPAQFPLADYPEIIRWFGGIAQIPAWGKTLEMQQQTVGGG